MAARLYSRYHAPNVSNDGYPPMPRPLYPRPAYDECFMAGRDIFRRFLDAFTMDMRQRPAEVAQDRDIYRKASGAACSLYGMLIASNPQEESYSADWTLLRNVRCTLENPIFSSQSSHMTPANREHLKAFLNGPSLHEWPALDFDMSSTPINQPPITIEDGLPIGTVVSAGTSFSSSQSTFYQSPIDDHGRQELFSNVSNSLIGLPTKHPVDDTGLNLNDLTYISDPQSQGYPYPGIPYALPPYDVDFTKTFALEESHLSSDLNIYEAATIQAKQSTYQPTTWQPLQMFDTTATSDSAQTLVQHPNTSCTSSMQGITRKAPKDRLSAKQARQNVGATKVSKETQLRKGTKQSMLLSVTLKQGGFSREDKILHPQPIRAVELCKISSLPKQRLCGLVDTESDTIQREKIPGPNHRVNKVRKRRKIAIRQGAGKEASPVKYQFQNAVSFEGKSREMLRSETGPYHANYKHRST